MNLAKTHTARSALRHGIFLALAMLAFEIQALSPSQVFDKVKYSVVVVKTLDANGNAIGQGSGVILPSGKIGTNCHVVKNGSRFQVGGGKQFAPATLWGSDEDKDICLLDATGLTGEPAQLGQASRLKVGEPVYAVGAPKGLELTLSDGIVSQLRGGPPPLIQTTAAISPGSSGGGLFDAEGRLVGFTTLYIDGGQSLNFALPVEWAGEIQPKKMTAQGSSEIDWLGRNSALIAAGNWIGSRDWCKQWTQAQPRNGNAWSQLGDTYLLLNSYTEAMEAYRQAVRIDPEDHYTWYVLGSAYILLKRYTEAIGAYKQVVRIMPKEPGAWNRIGFIYDTLKRYTEAVDAYRAAIRIDPKNAEAWEGIGSIYMGLERYAEAINALREAVRLNPKGANALNFLGLAYVISGNRAAALEVVSQLRHIDSAMADKLTRLVQKSALENRGIEDGWVKVGGDKADAHYANPSTIRRNGVMVKMWDIVDFTKAQQDKSIKPYKSIKEQVEYDCEEERLRFLSSSWHSENMAKGNVVFSDDEPSKWIAVSPNSRASGLWSVACGKP